MPFYNVSVYQIITDYIDYVIYDEKISEMKRYVRVGCLHIGMS